MIDGAPWTPLDFPPLLLMVGRGRRAARLDGRGGRRREPQPAMPRLLCGRAAIPFRRRGGSEKCAGHKEARGDVVGRRGNFGSGDTVVERGTSAELAARRVDDTGGDQPAVTQKTIGETICARGWTRMVRPPVQYTEELSRS
jgi:hypothetical protein